MNITVDSQVLAQELRVLSKVTATKPTLPILGHVLLRADDQLYLTATDFELWINSRCPANVVEKGEITLPAKALLDIVERLPNATITIADGAVSAGSFKSRLATLPPADFPVLPKLNGNEETVLSAGLFHTVAERSCYAISDKEDRYILRGAQMSLVGPAIAMVATDGKRLSVAAATRDSGFDAAVLIPTKALNALIDQPTTGELRFSKTDNHLFFNYGTRLLISGTLNGEFPKYKRIIPDANEHVARIERSSLMTALGRVGLVSAAVTLRFSPGSLELTGRSAEVGKAEESITIQYDGPPIEIHVHWKYVLDFLEHAIEPVVNFSMKDGQSPLLLTDGPDFLNVIMVIR